MATLVLRAVRMTRLDRKGLEQHALRRCWKTARISFGRLGSISTTS
jgi:hypothetical protein